MVRTNKKIRIFSALEIANICGVVNQTAINWIKKGHLRAFITPGGQYRVYANELFNFLSARGMEIPVELQRLYQEEPGAFAEQDASEGDSAVILLISENRGNESNVNGLIGKVFASLCSVVTVYTAQDASKAISDHKPMFVVIDTNSVGEEKIAIIKEFVEQLKRHKILDHYSQIVPVSFDTFNELSAERMDVLVDKNTYTDLRFLPKLFEKFTAMITA